MILCCGEALIDMLPRHLPDGESVFLPVAGGAMLNTAIGLGRLGEGVSFFSALSKDMFGDQLIETLHASKVQTNLCPRSDKASTLAFVKLTNGQAQYSFFDENSAMRGLDVDDLPKLPAEIKALHFGAISLIPEPCGTAFETLLNQNTDRVISLDPNIRPGFITDEAAHRARIKRMIEQSDIVKVSDEDLDWIEPSSSPQNTMQSWIKSGVSIVLYTQGAEGVTAYTKDGSAHQAVEPVEVVDTIGAGDTFNSGFLSGLIRSDLLTKSALSKASPQDLKPALQRAVKVAAFTVGQAGANPPWEHEL